MNNTLQNIFKSRLYRNSIIFFLASFLGAFINYVFHFVTARMLGPEGYGEMHTLISLSLILAIPISVMTMVVTRMSAVYEAKKEDIKIYLILKKYFVKILVFGLALAGLFLLFVPFVAGYLKIESSLALLILALSVLVSVLTTLPSGILQGLQRFGWVSAVSLVSVVFKLGLAALFIYLGFNVAGAMGAILIATIISLVVSFVPLRKYFEYKNISEMADQPKVREFISFSIPTFLTLFCLSLLANLDLILVKHFLPAYDAGLFAALFLAGHILFFVCGPLVTVMFPASSASFAAGSNPFSVLKKTFSMTTILGIAALVLFFLLPGLIMQITAGDQYIQVASYLGWYGFSILLYTIIYLMSHFLLSIKKYVYNYILIIMTILQVLLIYIFHDSIKEIVWVDNGVMALGTALFVIYFFKVSSHATSK